MTTGKKFDAEAYVDAALPMLSFAVDPAWRPSILANFRRTAEIAEAFLAFPLDDAEEPAPVYAP